MTPAQIAMQQEMERDIAAYVREAQRMAPIRVEHVLGFLSRVRRMDTHIGQVRDRVAYLVSRGILKAEKVWQPGEGEVETYTITADGMDALDGRRPW
jgi:hypothetical protein